MAVSVVTNDSKMSSEDEQKMMHMMMMRSRSSTKQADNRAREVRSGCQGVMCHVPSFAVAAVLIQCTVISSPHSLLYCTRTVLYFCTAILWCRSITKFSTWYPYSQPRPKGRFKYVRESDEGRFRKTPSIIGTGSGRLSQVGQYSVTMEDRRRWVGRCSYILSCY